MSLAKSTVQRQRDKFVETGKGNTAVRVSAEEEGAYAIRVAEKSGDSNITYVGKAEPGTATSASSWQIMEVDESSGTVVTWAGGDSEFTKVWDDRESLSYS